MEKLIPFSLLLLSSSVFSQHINDNNSKHLCQTIQDNQQRLNCYDKLYQTQEKEKKIINYEGHKKSWQMTEGISPIDDSKIVTLFIEADIPINFKYKSKTPVLYLRCKQKETSIFINFNTFFGTDIVFPVTRIDSERAITSQAWKVSANYQSISYRELNDKKTTDLIKTLLNKQKYFVLVTPNGETPLNATFSLDGLEQAIEPLRQACEW